MPPQRLSARRRLVVFAAMPVFAGACKSDCRPGYTLRKDGVCYGTAVVGQEAWDTGDSAGGVEPVSGTLDGEVRRGNVDLSTASSVKVEIWTGQQMGLYGPDRDRDDPEQEAALDVAALQAGETATFSEPHAVIPLRGIELFVYAAVEPEGSGRTRFYAAVANPYTLFQDIEPPSVEVVIDSTTETDW